MNISRGKEQTNPEIIMKYVEKIVLSDNVCLSKWAIYDYISFNRINLFLTVYISDGGSTMPDILSAPGVFRVQVGSGGADAGGC